MWMLALACQPAGRLKCTTSGIVRSPQTDNFSASHAFITGDFRLWGLGRGLILVVKVRWKGAGRWT